MVYRDGLRSFITGAYLIAVFAFGVASMKAMDRVFDAMGQEQHRTHHPQWYSDTFVATTQNGLVSTVSP
jgi:hypothetical protein